MTRPSLRASNDDLRRRLDDAEGTLRAIRGGGVDALLVDTPHGPRVYTLESADRPYRLLVEEMQQAAATVQLDGTIVYCNRQLAQLLRTPHESLVGSPFAQQFPPESRPVLEGLLGQGREETGREETWLRRSDGALVPVFLTCSSLPPECGAAVAILVTDLTSQKHHEQVSAAHEAVRRSEERYRSLVSVITDVPWTADAAGRFAAPQATWEAYTGQTWKAHRGFGWLEALHPDDRGPTRDAWGRACETGALYRSSGRLWHSESHEYRHFVARATPLLDERNAIREWVGACTDVHDQTLADENLQLLVDERTTALEISHHRLRVAERMASLGTLSAGLGHDMGNLLVPVRIRLDSLTESSLTPQAREDIRAIRTSAEYLQRLANGLRLLAIDPGRSQLGESTNLGSWWADALGVLKSVLPRGVVLEADLPEGECLVSISRAMLTQVVFNLVQNAGDAMKERGAGRIHVEGRSDGDTLRLRIRDDGPGMSPDVKARCMEPYFTTKPRGISTGLGLSLVYGLVAEAGGRVELESAPGKGTTFTIHLHLRADRPRALASGARKRALVEVADPRLRSFVAGELRALGYELTGAPDGANPIDLAVIDDARSLSRVSGTAPVAFLGARTRETPDRVRALGERPAFATIQKALRAFTGAESAGAAEPVA